MSVANMSCILRTRTGSTTSKLCNRIGAVMVSVLAWSAVDKEFECRLGQTKDGLALNQDNVTEWGDMPIRRLLFQ